MRGSGRFGDFRHTFSVAKIAPELPIRRKKTHLAENKRPGGVDHNSSYCKRVILKLPEPTVVPKSAPM
jgi:hypothetical protein